MYMHEEDHVNDVYIHVRSSYHKCTSIGAVSASKATVPCISSASVMSSLPKRDLTLAHPAPPRTIDGMFHSLLPRHSISEPGGRLAASHVAAAGVLRPRGSRGDVAEVLRGRAGVLL